MQRVKCLRESTQTPAVWPAGVDICQKCRYQTCGFHYMQVLFKKKTYSANIEMLLVYVVKNVEKLCLNCDNWIKELV